MASTTPASWSDLDARHRFLARSDWVTACEAALGLHGVPQFLDWMDRFVRPLVGYRIMACGTGVFLSRGVSVDRLLLRGVRQDHAEQLRDESGTVLLPRAWAGARDGLRPVDLAMLGERIWAERPASFHSLVGSAMERSYGSRQRGSYFLFAAPANVSPARVDYGMRLLGPHMHDALLAALAGERVGLDERRPVDLTLAERQILDYLVAGHTSATIARETSRSSHTVTNHVRSIIHKLNARTRTEAISKALGLGLVASVDRAPFTRITAAQPKASYLVTAKSGHGSARRYKRLSQPRRKVPSIR